MIGWGSVCISEFAARPFLRKRTKHPMLLEQPCPFPKSFFPIGLPWGFRRFVEKWLAIFGPIYEGPGFEELRGRISGLGC